MRSISTVAACAAALFVSGCATDTAHGPRWSYAGPAGANHWAELDPAFKTCGSGREQSPINIETAQAAPAADAKPLRFGYAASAGSVVNNGHTIQVDLVEGGTLSLDDGAYRLVQFHFHTPSEEQIDGQYHPLVAHLVHRSEQGRLAVVAVLFKTGQENAALKPVFDNLPVKSGAKNPLARPLDAGTLLPADRAHYAFSGSLTTPPCSEGVLWHVLKTPVELSQTQLQAFGSLYDMNARPVQATNGRSVRLVP
jgi:carbonic anhydrase